MTKQEHFKRKKWNKSFQDQPYILFSHGSRLRVNTMRQATPRGLSQDVYLAPNPPFSIGMGGTITSSHIDEEGNRVIDNLLIQEVSLIGVNQENERT